MGVHKSFVREEPLDLQCLTMTLATHVVEDVCIFLDILTWEFSAILERPTSLLECKLILRRLLVLHNQVVLQWYPITFAAVICDADEPYSVNTAYETEPSFTMPPRSTTRLLYF